MIERNATHLVKYPTMTPKQLENEPQLGVAVEYSADGWETSTIHSIHLSAVEAAKTAEKLSYDVRLRWITILDDGVMDERDHLAAINQAKSYDDLLKKILATTTNQ